MRIITGSMSRRRFITLVAPGALVAPLVLTRSQSSAFSTSLGADGATWQEFGANTPRFFHAARHLLVGTQRTNSVRNPRAEGVVLGPLTGAGRAPTNWAIASSAPGVTITMAAGGVENGVEYTRVVFSGTATGAGSLQITPVAPTDIAAATGQTWAASFFTRVAGGVLPGAASILFVERDSGGTAVVFGSSAVTVGSEALGASRVSAVRTLNGGATVAAVTARIDIAVASGVTVDLTLDVGWPQIEQGGFASTPVLPPVGTLAASTRGADIISAPLSALAIGINGACTVLWRGQLDSVSVNQALTVLNDGTTNNEVQFRADSSGQLALELRNAAVSTDTFVGAISAGTEFRCGFSSNGAGRVAASLNGGAVSAGTTAPFSGLTELRAGSRAAGARQMHGRISTLRVTQRTLSDSELQAAVASL